MSEQAKVKSSVSIWIFWVIVGMLGGNLAIQIFDRFSPSNDSAWSFYVPSTDMTCIVARSRGQEIMSCLPGDHRIDSDG